jgi:hypothetical protein
MFIVFFLLRTYLLPASFTLRIDQLPNITFELSIPKDLCAGVIGLFIRLGLKGIIEDLFAEWFSTKKTPNPLIMMSEQNKGGSGAGEPSGSSGPSSSGGGSGSGEPSRSSGPSGSGGGSGSGEPSRSGEPSGSGEPSNSSEKPVADKGKRTITDSDYEWDSDIEKDKFSDSSSEYYESEANKLLYGPTEKIQTASKELLEETLDAAKFIKQNYEERCEKTPELIPHLKDITKKHDLIKEELEKFERGERENIIKEDKGKGKEKKN